MLHGGGRMPKRVGVIKNEIFDGDDHVVIMWTRSSLVIVRSEATKQSICPIAAAWIASLRSQ
jgi:hypothetical protein